MTEVEMRDVVLRGFAARDAGRANELMAVFHDRAVFRIAASKQTLAIADAAEGHANIRSTMEGFIDTFGFADREVLGWFFGRDQIAVHSRLKVTFIPKNATFMTEIMDLFKFEDGKISELIEFADTALIDKILSGQI
jgi:ketosteroid isomerase-like protein